MEVTDLAFQWNQSLSVGVDSIDDQHRQIFSRINRLLEATSQGKGRDEVGQVMQFLGSYVVGHFGAEETYMGQTSYPATAAHKAEHSAFLREFSDLSAQFRKEGATSQLVIAIQRKVCDWLINHIGKSDKQLAAHLLRSQPAGVR